MKRRTIGAAGALALTASLVLATGPAFADEPHLGVDETYDFTSATHLSYIQHYRDSSKTLITEQTCSYISSTNSDLKTKFHIEGSVNVCDVITEVNETDIDEFLEVAATRLVESCFQFVNERIHIHASTLPHESSGELHITLSRNQPLSIDIYYYEVDSYSIELASSTKSTS